ncbi:MAG: hypothetical protein AVDCRST_MAG40-1483, partial [uncultured Gemmatimonadaceae bacterium]
WRSPGSAPLRRSCRTGSRPTPRVIASSSAARTRARRVCSSRSWIGRAAGSRGTSASAMRAPGAAASVPAGPTGRTGKRPTSWGTPHCSAPPGSEVS